MLTDRERRLALGTAVLLGLLLLWRFYLQPTIDRIGTARDEVEQLQDRAHLANLALTRARRDVRRLPELEEKLAESREDPFLDLLQSAVDASGVENLGAKSTDVPSGKGLQVHGRRYQVRGGLKDLTGLLASLDGQSILLAIDSISLNTSDGRSFEAALQLTTVSDPDSIRPGGESTPYELRKPGPGRTAGDFELIWSRNVYAPYRPPPPPPRPKPEPVPTRRIEVRENFTTAITFWDFEGDCYRAFVEDREGHTRVVSAGDGIGEWTVTSVDFTGLVLAASDGASRTVVLGESFEGSVIGYRDEKINGGTSRASPST